MIMLQVQVMQHENDIQTALCICHPCQDKLSHSCTSSYSYQYVLETTMCAMQGGSLYHFMMVFSMTGGGTNPRPVA